MTSNAINSISNYLSAITKADIQNLRVERMIENDTGKKSKSIRNKRLVKFGIAAACAVVFFIAAAAITNSIRNFTGG
jgi:hypothetical protein